MYSKLDLPRSSHALHAHQRGASLVTSLIFLLVVTLMAISASWQGISQQKLASGQRQSSLALSGADSAARFAERWLYDFYLRSNGEALVGTTGGGNGVHAALYGNENNDVRAFFAGPGWTDNMGVTVPADQFPVALADPSAALTSPPVYLIEDLGSLRPSGASNTQEGGVTGDLGYSSGGMQPGANAETRIYRVTAKSKSLNDAPVRTVQSVFAGRPKA